MIHDPKDPILQTPQVPLSRVGYGAVFSRTHAPQELWVRLRLCPGLFVKETGKDTNWYAGSPVVAAQLATGETAVLAQTLLVYVHDKAKFSSQ